MPTFIELTDYDKDESVWVNIYVIRTIRPYKDEDFRGTTIEMPENEIEVYGTPEEVLSAIEKAKGDSNKGGKI